MNLNNSSFLNELESLEREVLCLFHLLIVELPVE